MPACLDDNMTCKEQNIKSDFSSMASDDEVVISGLAGRYPDSNDALEFRNNLFGKIDLVSNDTRRWQPTLDEIPQRTGKINYIEKFDAGYFGLHQRHSHYTDPMARLMVEKSVEAVIDAGVNPVELQGTNTGVFIGICASETEKHIFYGQPSPKINGVVGCVRSIAAQLISYHLKLNGPSFICDSACSSSLYALEMAYKHIILGKCDQAIVGGVNVCLLPQMSLQFARLGMLSPDGVLRSFDIDANGYVRSEAVCAIFLQKMKDSRRVYARVVHSKVNCDGYKSEGITYPSGVIQKVLLEDFYAECNISPSSLSFIEAHGTGTKVGDPEEVLAIDAFFCKTRKDPLLIGSVKSNIGHTEPASGLCSVTKVIFAMETGFIPPNINFTAPKPEIEALAAGRIKVVSEKTPWMTNNGLIAVNNFGFGGANSHVLLGQNKKLKLNGGAPDDDLPRLVCVSGRTEEAVALILDELKDQELDVEYISLFHKIFSQKLPNETYRGFSIINKEGEISRSLKYYEEKRRLCFCFGEEVCIEIGNELLSIEPFNQSIKRINIAISKLVNSTPELFKDNSTNYDPNILSTVVIQMGLVDLMKRIDVVPDYIMGFGAGNLVCAYYENLLSLEQVLKVVHIMESLDKNSTSFEILQQLTKIIPSNDCYAPKWVGCHRINLLDVITSALFNSEQLENVQNGLPKETTIMQFGGKATIGNITPFGSNGKDYVNNMIYSLGQLYMSGANFKIENCYPSIKYPVSRGTPMISPLLRWDYSQDWLVVKGSVKGTRYYERYVINTKYNDWAFLTGHMIDGRNLFPAAGYLYLVWQTFAEMRLSTIETSNVTFECVKFIRATPIPNNSSFSIDVSLKFNGNFEVSENGELVATGSIFQMESSSNDFTDFTKEENTSTLLPLSERDIYKELRLRGYNYSGAFCGMKECDNYARRGFLKWEGNWITFMDSMLQIQILQVDSRDLFVPTGIQQMIIRPQTHLAEVNNGTIPIHVQRNSNILKSGGIEMRTVGVSPISKRKLFSDEILESYVFVPNEGVLDLAECIRVNVQIILENSFDQSFKVVEVMDENEGSTPLSNLVQKVLADQPLIQADIKVLSKETYDLPGVIFEDKPLNRESNVLLVIGTEVLMKEKILQDSLAALNPNGYILSTTNNDAILPENLEILTRYKTESDTIQLMRKKSNHGDYKTIDFDTENFNWLPKIQRLLKTNTNVSVISRNPVGGVMGFINCARRESNVAKLSCVYMPDKADVALSDEFYQRQLKKGMAMNVLKDSKWGTYRHLLTKISPTKNAAHAFASVVSPGDFSSLTWVEGPLSSSDDNNLCYVYYTSLNFRDILTASGRLPPNMCIESRLAMEGFQGFEIAGRDASGKRIVAMTQRGGLSSICIIDPYLRWYIPDHWSMLDAVTIPVVYSTVLYAIRSIGGLKRGQTILIHAGSGGVGQAAINVALHHGCTVFTTVGSKEKRTFIKTHFPEIKEEHIGNSRDSSFEQMVYEQTKGKGVDVVLNSLADESLLASVRCLAKGGNFLEIGKFDLVNNTALGLLIFQRSITISGIMLDLVFGAEQRKSIQGLLRLAIDSGCVHPLKRVVYDHKRIEDAFRFMATGKHIGKVVVQMRDDDTEAVRPERKLYECTPKFYCRPECTYVLVGGIGGFGMELADWLITKGCKRLMFVSRSGVKNGYQDFRIRFWRKYLDVLEISTEDVATLQGCYKMLEKAEQIGPVDAIFNLAMVLKDDLLENQTVENFKMSLQPKAIATQHLDTVSRKICPKLRKFLVFSSASCGRGNPGQTNYGMANSVMEMICEKRNREGLPALAIQWGAIGDVGFLVEMMEMNKTLVIGGTLQQKISNCLALMDEFLTCDITIVSSMVVAEKRAGGNLEEVICNILGIKDLKTINYELTLPELGMDSITGVEIKQLIERELEIALTPQEMKSMTFIRLRDLSERTDTSARTENKLENQIDWLNMLLKNMKEMHLSDVPMIKLASLVDKIENCPTVIFLPGIEGMSTVLEPLTSKLKCHALGYQFLFKYVNDNVQALAKSILPFIKMNGTKFTVVAYSFGCLVALELIALLESEGQVGNVVFIDGAPRFFQKMVNRLLNVENEDVFKTSLLLEMVSSNAPVGVTSILKEKLSSCASFEEKFDMVIDSVAGNITFSESYLRESYYVTYNRLKAVEKYQPTFTKLKSKMKLFRARQGPEETGDYGLSELFQQPVELAIFNADHVSILQDDNVAIEINEFIHRI